MVQMNEEDTVTKVVSSDRLSYWLYFTLWDPYFSGTTSQMALNRKRAQFKKWSKFARVLKSTKGVKHGLLEKCIRLH